MFNLISNISKRTLTRWAFISGRSTNYAKCTLHDPSFVNYRKFRFLSTSSSDEGGKKSSIDKIVLNTNDFREGNRGFDEDMSKGEFEDYGLGDEDDSSTTNSTSTSLLPLSIYGCIGLVGVGYYISYLQEKDGSNKEITISQILDDLSQRINDAIDYLIPTDNSPLLPDFHELNYPPNLPTLVIDLDKVIAKMEYDRKYGWRVKKRPYADKFFKELVNYYEIVIWSDDAYPVATDVANHWGLPVIGCIHRDQCKKYKGSYIKDLSRLGRDLKRVILVDHDKVAGMLQKENAILVNEFTGDESDMELYYLINLLKTIAMNPQDVTQQIKQYGGGGDYNIGKRFAEHASIIQERAKNRMNLSKMMGFKHY